MNLEIMEEKLKARLRPKRFLHSIGVRDSAVALAKRWGANIEQSAVAGLLHDCAKHLSEEEGIKLFDSVKHKADAIVRSEKGLWHAFLGAELAKSEFGIEDEEILDAIRFHTIGKANMELLTKIIYIADMIEPGRDFEFEYVPELRKLAFENLDGAIIKCIDHTVKSIIQRGLLLHPATVEARNGLIEELRRHREKS